MICFPNAKINIGLHVLEKQKDGFHAIESLFLPIQLNDILEVVPQPQLKEKWVLYQSGLCIAGSEKENLVVRAYELLDKEFSLPPVSLYLHKVIPMGAGLGGGSANGAFTLTCINQLFNLGLLQTQLESYAAQLGSDCPFFIQNSPAFVSGRGDCLEPILNDKGITYFIVVVNPGYHVSTKKAYSQVVPNSQNRGAIERIISQPLKEWVTGLSNDFESCVFDEFPEVKRIKEGLYNEGALFASMTGSGSSVYGIFKHKKELKPLFPKSYYWSGYIHL